MDEFDLEVEHNGEIKVVPAKLVTTGFGYKIYVTAQEQEYIFERDDENKWRAVLPYGISPNDHKESSRIDKSFIISIGKAIEQTFP